MNRFLNWSLRAYRVILRLYPEDLCRDFGEEMTEAFEADLTEAWQAGLFAVLRVWCATLSEAIRIGLPGQLENPSFAVPALAAAMSIASLTPLLLFTLAHEPRPAVCRELAITLLLPAAVTAVTSFVAIRRRRNSTLISLGLAR